MVRKGERRVSKKLVEDWGVGVSLFSLLIGTDKGRWVGRGKGEGGAYVEKKGDGIAGLEFGRGEETGYELGTSFRGEIGPDVAVEWPWERGSCVCWRSGGYALVACAGARA